jgi:hypothetical protein
MSASLATGHKSTSHAELKAGVVSGFPDPERPSFIPDWGGSNPNVLTGAVATLLIIDVLRVKSIITLIRPSTSSCLSLRLKEILVRSQPRQLPAALHSTTPVTCPAIALLFEDRTQAGKCHTPRITEYELPILL